MLRFLLLGLVFAACSGGPTIPDGGTACSINADCPRMQCQCPLIYQNCVGGICSTTCPNENATPVGQSCGAPCECQSGSCGVDKGLCCAALTAGAGGSGQSCQKDCDCIGGLCSSNVCM